MSEPTFGRDYLEYRPNSYFWAEGLGLQLPPQVQGAERRRIYEKALSEGEVLPEDFVKPTLGEEERRAWGSIHPAMMGGEYLPALRAGEVEVARIVIASTTCDVTCVYAIPKGNRIALRVVDEYEGMTLDAPVTRTVGRPLSLHELLSFFLKAWDIQQVLAANFQELGFSRCEVHAFITSATSSYYPGFEAALRERVDQWLAQVSPQPLEGEEGDGADEWEDGS